MTLTPIDADNEEDNRDEGESSPTPRRELVDIWIIFFISNLYTLLEWLNFYSCILNSMNLYMYVKDYGFVSNLYAYLDMFNPERSFF